jgi:hypothetical protein
MLDRKLKHFQAKRIPVRVKKMRQNKKLEPISDFVGTEKAPERPDLVRGTFE